MVRIIPVGLRALLVEVTEPAHTAALAADLHRWRDRGELAGVWDVVPGELTVLLDGLDDPPALAGRLAGWRPSSSRPPDGPLVEVPVRYDGADLAEVARHWRVTEEEVRRIHSAPEYRVAFCGFAPGFGYLTGLPERYHLPRRAVPRTRVPAGSVALAGGYAGIYPRDSPGGWQLLGCTDLVLFDPDRDPVALLTPGTRVRFRDVDVEDGSDGGRGRGGRGGADGRGGGGRGGADGRGGIAGVDEDAGGRPGARARHDAGRGESPA
ncbi:5-oxoprolinase subunit PxpB [Plantactinospora sp. B6F1]|uniref:5-oxoprolinase subunit PxpB n=1 Tax=Plantactinospora sp. B6F1 TaxID=3158971 RepID=UPI0032D90226